MWDWVLWDISLGLGSWDIGFGLGRYFQLSRLYKGTTVYVGAIVQVNDKPDVPYMIFIPERMACRVRIGALFQNWDPTFGSLCFT